MEWDILRKVCVAVKGDETGTGLGMGIGAGGGGRGLSFWAVNSQLVRGYKCVNSTKLAV